jgi:hypothetical protein
MTIGDDTKRGTGPAAIEAEVIQLIKPFVGKRAVITSSTKIFHDLGIGGDDAFELLESIVKRFGTSFASLDFHAYFPNETESLSYFWFMKLGFYRTAIKPLTTAHMVAVIERGSWFEPAILSASSK